MNIKINDEKYRFLTGYQNNDKYRASLNRLTSKVFKLSLENWYQAGYWDDTCIAYTLFQNERAIANLLVNIMDFIIDGKLQKYIQIGTVTTDIDYRNKGLSRYLMDKVLEDYSNNTDLIYLYANKTVLDFYPKFGFEAVKEYEYFITKYKNTSNSRFVKLNMGIRQNRDFLYKLINNSKVFSKIACKNAKIVMFHCMSFMKDNVYYCKSLNAIAIAKHNDKKLHVFDVFSDRDIDLDVVLDSLITTSISEIVLGFTPIDSYDMKTRGLVSDDTLFIQGNHVNLFDNNKVMFPLLSHA